MNIKKILIAMLLTIFVAAPLSAETKWVEEFLRRYQPAAETTDSGLGTPISAVGEMLQTGTVPISMNDMVNMMLDKNLDIQSNRFSPRSAYYSDLVFWKALQPSVSFSGTLGRNTSQNTTQLNGAVAFVSQLTDNFAASFSQALPTGTSLLVNVTMNRLSSSALTNSFNPSYTGRVTYTVGQHLLNNWGRLVNTRQIIQGENTQKMSEITFETQVIALVVQAQKAYWDLVFSAEDLKIKQQSLDLANGTLSDNQMKVDIGTLAPIDVVQTKADVATRTDALVTSTFAVTTAEDQIKKLISSEQNPSLFLLKFAPRDTTPSQPASVAIPALEQAVKTALENRPELRSAALDLKNKQIDEQYTANQKLPILDATATFNQNGIGGTQTVRNGIGGAITGTVPGGIGDAFHNLFSYNYNGYSLGFSFTMPLSNRAAIADHDRATTERQLSEAKIAATAQTILLDVRNSLQQVQLNRARIDTARTALDLAQQKLTAEQTKFELGTSTLRFVLQEQTNVALAQTTELQTRINFAKALIDLDRAMGVTLSNNHIEVDKTLNQGAAASYKPLTVTNQPANQK